MSDEFPCKWVSCEAQGQGPDPDVAVSVIIPCYNAERWIGRAIQSALDQKGVSTEVIVIDDGSTDNSSAIIGRFYNSVTYELQSNQGACAARNRGLSLARGEYVIFLDADDYIEGPFLERGLEAMAQRKAEIGFGPLSYELNGERHFYSYGHLKSYRDAARFFIIERFTTPCATLWRRDFFKEIGGWNENIRRDQDLEIVYRALGQRPSIATWQQGCGVYFQHDSCSRISSRRDEATFSSRLEVLRMVKNYLASSEISMQEADKLVWRQYYRILREAARTSDRATYDLVYREWRGMGAHGHTGTLWHVVLSRALGLFGKERLVSILRSHLRLGTHGKL